MLRSNIFPKKPRTDSLGVGTKNFVNTDGWKATMLLATLQESLHTISLITLRAPMQTLSSEARQKKLNKAENRAGSLAAFATGTRHRRF